MDETMPGGPRCQRADELEGDPDMSVSLWHHDGLMSVTVWDGYYPGPDDVVGEWVMDDDPEMRDRLAAWVRETLGDDGVSLACAEFWDDDEESYDWESWPERTRAQAHGGR